MARVLSIGYLQDFLRQRNQHMRKAGHQVTPATSVQQSIDLGQKEAFDVLVFGHAVPTGDRNFIASHFRSAYPEIAIIFLYEDHIEKAELADAILNVRGDLGDLAQTVDYLYQRQPSKGRSLRNSAYSAAVMLPSIGEIISRLV